MSELNQHFESLNKDFHALKEYNEQKFKEQEDRSLTKDELDERMAKVTESMNKQEAALADLQTKMNRPSYGPAENQSDEKREKRRKAFDSFLRRGKLGMNPEELKTMTEGSESEGGAMAPDEFIADLLKVLEDKNPVRQLCRILGGMSKQIDFPARTVNLAANWIGEGAETSATQSTYATKSIPALKISALTPVTVELLEDAYFDVESLLIDDFATAFALTESTAILLGTGSGQPEGIIVDSAVPVVQATATASKIDEGALIDSYHSLKGGYAANSTWAMNMSTLGAVRTLKASESGDYLWQPGLAASDPPNLLGRPIAVCDSLADEAGDAKVAVIGDFKGGVVYDRLGMSVLRDDYTSSKDGIVNFVAHRRTGFLVADSAAFVIVQCKSAA
jgi:HK97 family phage major capsid protein